MSSADNSRPAGQPSTTTPMARPCDSPHVVMRNSSPKLFPATGVIPPPSTPPSLKTGRVEGNLSDDRLVLWASLSSLGTGVYAPACRQARIFASTVHDCQ